jgi:hypothetical protein
MSLRVSEMPARKVFPVEQWTKAIFVGRAQADQRDSDESQR